MAGLLSTGLVIKNYDEIIAEIKEDLKINLGSGLNVSDDSVIMQILKPEALQISELWEALQAIYNSTDPDTASDEALERSANIIGVPRLQATKSVVEVMNTGDHNTVIPINSVVEVDGTGSRFVNSDPYTLDLTNIQILTIEFTTVSNNATYTVTVDATPLNYLSDGSATAAEIAAGITSAINLSSLTVTATVITGNKVQITADSSLVDHSYVLSAGITPRKVTKRATFQADVTGVIRAPASTLNKIITPVSGWDSVYNPLDAVLGRDIETDTSFRVRRKASLSLAGASTLPAIRAALLAINAVTAVVVKENDTDVIDLQGRPPHSFEAIVLGGTDAQIAEVIWEDKPLGIKTYGSTTYTHLDEQNFPRDINFSRPTEIYLHVKIEYTLNSEELFPSGGEAAIAASVLVTGKTLSIGDNVIPKRFVGPIYTAVQGIEDLIVSIATSATPLGPPGAFSQVTLAIGDTELSSFDSGRITVDLI
jgi:uncharacterized phage protein gp47/JayE